MESSSFIWGWASLPETPQQASSESHRPDPFFLITAASYTPAQARSTRKILLYLYCLIIYTHLMRAR